VILHNRGVRSHAEDEKKIGDVQKVATTKVPKLTKSNALAVITTALPFLSLRQSGLRSRVCFVGVGKGKRLPLLTQRANKQCADNSGYLDVMNPHNRDHVHVAWDRWQEFAQNS
jgi:hypothetical protein